jgi:DNA-binding protein HU-beta
VNKSELADKIAASSGLSEQQATRVIDTVVGSITSALRKGDRVALLGFGTFSVSVRKARNGRNPQTGATIKIAARRIAKFSAGSELRNTITSFRAARPREDDAFVSTLAELSNFY